jgi:16S rRNA (guanine(1405)-N(7))-methyltransferase
MAEQMQLADLVHKVQANPKYAAISRGFVERLSAEALTKGLTGKAAVKDVRNTLHQVGGAYFRRQINFEKSRATLEKLPIELTSEEAKGFCRKQMQGHASMVERLPILNEFFQTALAPIAPVTSVLDLACGLNPLAIPWMPLVDNFIYQACDIYLDMLDFLQSFFDHFSIQGKAFPCDIIDTLPDQPAQVAVLLKSMPCLEQLDKDIGSRLLEKVNAAHILVSFPVSSLSGHKKGMPDFYRQHFYEIVAGKPWSIQEFSFTTELAFLVSK